MKGVLAAFFRLVLGVFFERIEVRGLEKVPATGPIIFVVNHPNGLVDPMFLFALMPRPVSFLAKAPLFRMPLIGWFTRALESIPVYRLQDDASSMAKNQETFKAAQRLLESGGTIALFPEGVSHSDSKLKPMKSGAARIALGSRVRDLKIVPAGLYYTAKHTFRSSVLLLFGEPFQVQPVDLDGEGGIPRERVRALTEEIGQSLAGVTLQAESVEALRLVEFAERLHSSAAGDPTDLARRFEVRRQFLAAYPEIKRKHPERTAQVERDVERLIAELGRLGLEPETLAVSSSAAWLSALKAALVPLLLLVPGAVGTVIHYPAYRLTGFLAVRYWSQDDDLISTVKMIGSLLFFPLTWLVVSGAAGALTGNRVHGLLAFGCLPILAAVALVFAERTAVALDHFRITGLALRRSSLLKRLQSEHARIRLELEELGRLRGE